MESSSANQDRRALLTKALSLVSTLAVANIAVYFVGAAFKELDGSFFVAGAKSAN